MTEEHPGAERRTDDARRAALMFATLGFAAEQTAATHELFLACFKSTRYCASLSSISTGGVLAVAAWRLVPGGRE